MNNMMADAMNCMQKQTEALLLELRTPHRQVLGSCSVFEFLTAMTLPRAHLCLRSYQVSCKDADLRKNVDVPLWYCLVAIGERDAGRSCIGRPNTL